MEEQAKQIAELLKVLANESRLLIVCCLMEQPLAVNEISKYVPNITQSALSQHLSLLKAHRILDFTKTGVSVTYSIADRRIIEIIKVLTKHYC
ncbi:MAG: metalloregulator ArsR/SmtB family transcription factor [Clostridiales bacterium]|nr:metalloregulator ArsR/SmtB family transcription factor [Clostridiales bacterium]